MNSAQQPTATRSGAKEMRRKANERLGQWVRGKWRIDKLLGVGGMASVYAATHRNGSRVALKILHTEFAREEAVKQRFLREGYVANKVDHKGRVAILDDDETEQGEPFLVMELLEGETLQQLWKRHKRKVPVAQALSVVEAVLDTLVPFHEKTIIHRDLKPANIFITHAGEVKLLDFGVAQLREQGGEALTRAGTALGTPSYMSPEQAMGKSDQLDGRSDVFSVGATLYAVLSGKRLHHGKSDNEAFILAATQPAPSLARSAPDLPVQVIALVDRSMQWDRRKRFRTAGDMRDACRQVLAALGGTAGAPPSLPAGAIVSPTSTGATEGSSSVVGGPSSQPSGSLAPSAMSAAASAARSASPSLPGPSSAPASSSGGSPLGPAVSTGLPPGSGAPPASGPAAALRHTPPSGHRISHSSHEELKIDLDTGSMAPPVLDAAVSSRRNEAAEQEGALLSEVFSRFEKALPTLRHYGLDHPEGQVRVRAVHRAIVDALRVDPAGVKWMVHPFCFTHGQATVWEPGPPLDQVPYSLASTGVDEVHIMSGVTETEVRAFLKAVVIDPQLGAAESDIGGALWEAGFEHIVCTVRDDLTDADAREQIRFFAEAEEVESEVREELKEVVATFSSTARPQLDRAGRVEAAAMAMGSEGVALEAAQRARRALALEPAAASALGAQLTLADEQWRERFLDVAADAYLDAVEREDPAILDDTLAEHAECLARAKRYGELFDLHQALTDRLGRLASQSARPEQITRAMFRWPPLSMAFALAQSEQVDEGLCKTLLEGLAVVLPALGPELLDKALEAANGMQTGELFELAMAYVERSTAGHEKVVVAMLDALRPELAQRMLACVTASRSAEAITLLKPLLMSRNPALRCEATALLASSPEQLGKQLVRLLGSADPRLRAAALTTMERHQVRVAGPGLVGVVEAEGFIERPSKEQRQMFQTLYSLNPPRAERLLVAIVNQHGLMADEAVNRVRALAADVLGKLADSPNPLDALEAAARRRPWNTQALRMAADHAATAIRERLARPRPDGGGSR